MINTVKHVFVCLILYVLVNSFQLCRDGSSWVEPVLSKDKGHNAVTPLRLKSAAPRSRVKHSTTEPLRSIPTPHKMCAYVVTELPPILNVSLQLFSS